MRFRVRRTSDWSDAQPCPEAEPGTYVSRLMYTFRTIADAEKWSQTHNSERRYELVNGKVCSPPRTEDAWFVRLDTLEALMAFKAKYGPLVLGQCHDNPAVDELEIYDGYRE